MRMLLACIWVAFAAASAFAGNDVFERIVAAQQLKVPLPESTPYDSDPKARAVYLEEYRAAYRLVLAAVDSDCHMAVKGYFEAAFQDGWRDGRKAAMKRHPEKVAQMYGLSLEDYLRYLSAQESGARHEAGP